MWRWLLSEHLGGLDAGRWASSKEDRKINLLPYTGIVVYGPKLRRTLDVCFCRKIIA